MQAVAPVAAAPVVRSLSVPPPRWVRPRLSDEVRRLLLLMSDQVTESATDDELYATNGLGLDLLSMPPIESLAPYAGQPVRVLRVPARLAEFLIEAFAVDEPPASRHRAGKHFPEQRTLRFAIPVPVPISVGTEKETVTLGFYDIPGFSSEQVQDLIKKILNIFARREVLVAKLNSVDSRGLTMTEVDDFAFGYDVCVLAQLGAADPDTESQSLSLLVMKSHWDRALEQSVVSGLKELYDDASLGYCKNCKQIFSEGDGPTCVTTRHSGRQIRFDNGEWEVVEYTEDDEEPITFIKYTCCGEVPMDEQGCEEVKRGAHELDSEKVISSFELCTQTMLP